jgi:hypothetical protein
VIRQHHLSARLIAFLPPKECRRAIFSAATTAPGLSTISVLLARPEARGSAARSLTSSAETIATFRPSITLSNWAASADAGLGGGWTEVKSGGSSTDRRASMLWFFRNAHQHFEALTSPRH